jgi:two-component system cell cycle sensor histidine kinase/response regulator CckA
VGNAGQRDRSFRLLVEETSATSGMDYLRSLARNTARALRAQWAFIGRVVDGEPRRVQVMVLWEKDDFGEPFSYDLPGTPCERVVAGELCHVPDKVRELFPDDELLERMGVEAYSGVTIADHERTHGLLAALYDHPIGSLEGAEPLLWVAASRAALEIERMESEAALRASEARYRNFIEQCNEGVWSIDAAGVTDFVNAQMARMLGRRPEEMLGRPMYDFMDTEARAQAEQNMARRSKGIRERHSFRWKHADGSDVWTEMATCPMLDDEGAMVGALALVTDVTEQRRLHESIQQKQKLESLGVLAGGVAHDFNNLLAAILGNTDLGLMHSDVAPAPRELLERIQSAALQAAELTKQLLAYAGRTPFRMEPLSIAELVSDISAMLSAAVPASVSLSVTADPLPDIEGDRTQLTQVLMNLVLNASDALGADGGEVRIRTGVLEPVDDVLKRGYVADQLRPVEHVFVRVEDDGVGMDDEVRAHLFDPFFSTKASGHGLGLAASLGILRRHGGTIVVDSVPGEGSVFTVCLPVSDARRDSAGAEKSPSAGGLDGRRLLVVDDEPAVREVVGRVLRVFGATVDEAAGGAEALALVDDASDPHDVILLDMAMPDMDGEETLRRLRATGCEAPVILCSGHAAQSLPDQPGVSWLAKPFRAPELRDAIRAVLEE